MSRATEPETAAPATEAGRRLSKAIAQGVRDRWINDQITAIEREAWNRGYQDAQAAIAAPLALREVAALPEGRETALDVERLARAMGGGMDIDRDRDEWYGTPRELAARFAAEYARLAPPATDAPER